MLRGSSFGANTHSEPSSISRLDPVAHGRKVECLVLTEAAMPLLGPTDGPAHDWKWVGRGMAAKLPTRRSQVWPACIAPSLRAPVLWPQDSGQQTAMMLARPTPTLRDKRTCNLAVDAPWQP